jgi:hypothetical protein
MKAVGELLANLMLIASLFFLALSLHFNWVKYDSGKTVAKETVAFSIAFGVVAIATKLISG